MCGIWSWKKDIVRKDATDDMLADYMTKRITGQKFHKFRNLLVNHVWMEYHQSRQPECVGSQIVKKKKEWNIISVYFHARRAGVKNE